GVGACGGVGRGGTGRSTTPPTLPPARARAGLVHKVVASCPPVDGCRAPSTRNVVRRSGRRVARSPCVAFYALNVTGVAEAGPALPRPRPGRRAATGRTA